MLSAFLIAALLAQVEASPADQPPGPAPKSEVKNDSPTASKITVSGKMTLDELRAEIEKQTGNKITDYRQRFNQNASNPKLTLDIKNAPFWPAIDAILDQTGLTVYDFSGKDGLALTERSENETPRAKRATYAGPLRMEVTRLVCERKPNVDPSATLHIHLAIAWEPRLAPILFIQPVKTIQAVDDQGRQLHFDVSDPQIEVSVEGGTGVELMFPFTAPPRDATAITSIKGTLTALLAGKLEPFEFDKLADAAKPGFKPLEIKKDTAHVILDQVRKNNEIWEVLVRVRFDDAEKSLEPHLGWISQNEAYIVGPDKNPIEKAGFFVNSRTDKEIGLGYQFELPETGLDGCTFVYKSASSIHSVLVPYELKNLTLP